MFFKRTTRKAAAVIDAFHAASSRLREPEDALTRHVFVGLVSEVLRRHRAGSYAALPPRILRDLAMVLVLVHEDRPSFDRALVMAGIPVEDIVGLRNRAGRRPELVERVRLALRATLAEARARRAPPRGPVEAQVVEAQVVETPAVDAAVVQAPVHAAEPRRLAA